MRSIPDSYTCVITPKEPPMAYSDPTKKRAAMIVFPDRLTKDQCDDILARMLKAGYCEPAYGGDAPTCTEYDPDMSCPTLYFP